MSKIPSCPQCGFSVTKISRQQTSRWSVEKQRWVKYFSDPRSFECSHCGLDEWAEHLIMRESTGGE